MPLPSEDAIAGTPALKRWRQPGDRRSWSTRARAALSVILVFVLCVFLVWVFRPLSHASLHVATIAPREPATDKHGQAVAEDDSVQQVAWHSSQRVRELATSLPTVSIALPTHIGDSESFTENLPPVGSSGPLLIHVSGYPTVSKSGTATLLSGRESSESFDLSDSLKVVAESGRPTIYLIDAIRDSDIAIGDVPEYDAWKLSRSISQTIDQLDAAKVIVVLQWSGVSSSRLRVDDRLARCSSRLISAFGPLCDVDQDGAISAGELIHWLLPSGRRKSAAIPCVYSTTRRSDWDDVILCPIAEASDDLPNDAIDDAPSTVAGELAGDLAGNIPPEESGHKIVTDSEIPDASDSGQRKIEVTAPTLAIARQLSALGFQTRRADECEEISETFFSHLHHDAVESVAMKWLQEPSIATASWDELVWMREVCSRDLPWQLKQSLTEARALAHQLTIDATYCDGLADRLTTAQWIRLDAERSLASGVRRDNIDHVTAAVEESITRLRSLQADAQIIQEAARICEETRTGMASLLQTPVRGNSPAFDLVCRMLEDVVDLQSCLKRHDRDQVRDCRLLVRSIRAQRVSNPIDSSHTPSFDEECDSSEIFETTHIRIRRAALAITLLQMSEDAYVLRAANEALGQLRFTEPDIKAIDSKMSAFAEAIHRVKPQKIEPVRARSRERAVLAVRSVIKDAAAYAKDGTKRQRDNLDQISQRARRIAAAFGETIVGESTPNVNIDVATHGSLATSSTAWLDVHVRNMTKTSASGRLEIEFDRDTVEVTPKFSGRSRSIGVGTRAVGELSYRGVAHQRSVDAPVRVGEAPEARVRIDLRRLPDSFHATAVNVRWITGNDVYRTSVPLELPLPPLVKLRIERDRDLVASGSHWQMRANESRSRVLWLKAANRTTGKFRVRLLSWAAPGMTPPPPTTAEVASEWLSLRTAPTILATQEGVSLRSSEFVPVLFKPAAPDPDTPPIRVGSLFCEVTDPNGQVVQMLDLSPSVIRPSSTVVPNVAYDHDAETVRIQLADPSPEPAATASIAHVEIREQESDRLIAAGEIAVPQGQSVSKLFSTASGQGRPLLARVRCDGWPSSFVYQLDQHHSSAQLSPSERSNIAIVKPATEMICRRDQRTIETEVWADITDALFRYGQDTITLGLDLNNDRYLTDEPSVSVTSPVSIQFTWMGIDDQGRIGMQSHVSYAKIALPLDGRAVNRRAQLIVKLQRGKRVDWSQPVSVVFDTRPPKIRDVQLTSPLPGKLGDPVEATVAVDDAGLSGAAAVRVGWATLGQLEFTSDIKTTAAQKASDGRWKVVVPTDGLVSGTNTLLVQPTDAAGNVGKTISLNVDLLTEQQLADLKNRATTVVRGNVAFVKRPAAGMTVKLTRKSDADETDPTPDGSDAPSKPKDGSPLTAKTDSSGEFVFPKVRAGQYELDVEGLYRGVRRKKHLEIAVKPPQPASLNTIRID